MKKKSDLIYQYYSDDVLRLWIAAVGLFATFLIGLWTLSRDFFESAVVFIYLSLILQFIVILYFFLVLYGSGKYKVIKLKLNIDDGHLTDVKTNFRNVALREKTLSKILSKLGNEKSFEVGREIGEDFHTEFIKNYPLSTEDDKKRKAMFKSWLEYDSGAGMGKLELTDYNDSIVQIKIISPFYGPCQYPRNPLTPRCKFLKGYLLGFIENSFPLEKIDERIGCWPEVTSCTFTFHRAGYRNSP